jgi:hypothetical protein
MKVGVLTRNGIYFSSRPFLTDTQALNSLKFAKDEDNPVKKLMIMKDKLLLSDTGKLKRLSYWEKVNLFNDMNALLQTTHKASMTSFVYANETELMKAQKALLDIGSHCLVFSEYVEFEMREYYYQILCNILKRSELDLG